MRTCIIMCSVWMSRIFTHAHPWPGLACLFTPKKSNMLCSSDRVVTNEQFDIFLSWGPVRKGHPDTSTFRCSFRQQPSRIPNHQDSYDADLEDDQQFYKPDKLDIGHCCLDWLEQTEGSRSHVVGSQTCSTPEAAMFKYVHGVQKYWAHFSFVAIFISQNWFCTEDIR